MMMLICIKQHLSNILGSIYEKVKHTEAELKNVAYKKVCISLVPIMILPRSWCESVFNLFLIPS